MGDRFYSPLSPLSQLPDDGDQPPPLSLPALHLADFDFDTAFHPDNTSLAPSSAREQPKARPLAHALTIHVPAPLTPSPSPSPSPWDRDEPSIASPPIFRHSPSVARRRTVIQHSSVTYEGNVVDLAETPPRQGTPEHGPVAEDAQVRPASVEHGSIIMPQPQFVGTKTQPASPRRLEKKPATHDLKQSPSSQSVRRSLPRPPKMDTPPIQQPVFAEKAVRQQPASVPVPAPTPTSTWPPLNIERQTVSPVPVEPAQMRPAYYAKKHQSNGSVSSIPVVAGLADAGPYFAATSSAPSRQPTARESPAPVATKAIGLGRPGVPAGAPGPSRVKQEEVCLECMMRDRDLADVDVQGEGVWGRASDVDLTDLIWREEALLKSMGDLNSADLHAKSDDATSEESRAEEDPEARQQGEQERAARHAAIQAKKQEADWRISREIGWRGFKWEEGREGEGLPRNFRGGKGGDLTIEGIKMVMTKFPSASAFRYQKLQDYLRNQWALVLETRAEAQRVGHFAFPDDLSPGSSTSSHEVRAPNMALPSAVAYASARGASGSSPRHATGGMRPSPSSPAGFSLSSTAAQAPLRQAPLQRPLTHYLPERELMTMRQPVTPTNRVDAFSHSNSMLTPQSRHFRNSPSQEPDTEELWSPDDEPTQNLRPFSFAVRAGAVARDGSEGGHGAGARKSLFGRWGGSVTSFFGGSQNGSGSMMDMHVGLESDKRNKATSGAYPRAVSLASPTRPSFFSNSSSVQSHDPPPQRISRAISHSLLSRVQIGEQEEGGATKKKGIKGFLKKMTGGKKKDGRSRANSIAQPSVPSMPVAQPETPLAPPPPISVLVGGRDPSHARQGSGSSSSMFTDGQESGSNRLSGSILYNRSVSAPLNNASSSDVSVGQSGSPASSRFMTTGQTKPESYSSTGGKRRSTVGEMGEERRSVMEMFTHAKEDGGAYDEIPASLRPGRPNNKTNTSLSASSGTMLETPPALNYGSGSFFSQQQTPGKLTINTDMPKHTPSNSIGSLSPNRYKNLPPIPPGDLGSNYPNQSTGSRGVVGSPDSIIAAFPDQEFAEYGGRVPTRQPTGPGSPFYNSGYPQPRHHQQMSQQRLQPTSAYAPGYGYGGRASLDQRASSPRVERGGQRAVQTMYGMPAGDEYGAPSGGFGPVEGDKKKKGLKGFFGGGKAGRRFA
ncbi:hypothetical protein L198_07564 [Cryptococcus wingfieldii CBS 7118]|uniref:Uncharacterized protein n=1 Tax=Cryptococcus wingfieldii CBS 7118 TaxID=1295528 RepID=A0A1E3ICK3_9TREE|nr:hypothetical protein L198_07564 [Cryptococcus wingfieldii CBS 7118]ODN85481.1 hypothetical protein L198_07564 [Cryptococcus wingfieldii CBS 7118]